MCLVVNIFTLLYSGVCLTCAQTEGFHLQAHSHAHLHMHACMCTHKYMHMLMAHESTRTHAVKSTFPNMRIPITDPLLAPRLLVPTYRSLPAPTAQLLVVGTNHHTNRPPNFHISHRNSTAHAPANGMFHTPSLLLSSPHLPHGTSSTSPSSACNGSVWMPTVCIAGLSLDCICTGSRGASEGNTTGCCPWWCRGEWRWMIDGAGRSLV